MVEVFATKTMRNARTENGALADPARSIEHGDPGGHQIRSDHLALALTAEEEQSVEV